MKSARYTGLTLVAALWLCCNAASAQDANQEALRVWLAPCVAVEKEPLQIAAALELGAILVSEPPDGHTHIAVTCPTPKRLELTLLHEDGATQLRRSIAWDNDDDAYRRQWLILMLGELIAASQYPDPPQSNHTQSLLQILQRQLPPTPNRPQLSSPLHPPAPSNNSHTNLREPNTTPLQLTLFAKPPAERSTRLYLTGMLMSADTFPITPGVELALEQPTWKLLGWRLAIQGAGTDAFFPEGDITSVIGAVSGGLMMSYPTTLIDLHLSTSGVLGLAHFDVYPGIDGALGERSFTRAWTAIEGRLSGDLPLNPGFLLRASTHLVVVAKPAVARVDDQHSIALDGLMLGGSLGLGWP